MMKSPITKIPWNLEVSDNVYIVIVNWNGWKDTIECLESVFRNDYPSYRVVVSDNGSHDGSLEKIKEWADGLLSVDTAVGHPLYGLSHPPVQKPIPYREYSRTEAEKGGTPDRNEKLILIRNLSNLGFAGGNNVGLRYVLSCDDFGYVWLLNNDTVIKQDALTCLVRRMRERRDAGMCGSTLPYYSDPDRVWALGGGRYNKWLAQSRNIGHLSPAAETPSVAAIESELDYLAGASMLVSRSFLKDIGLMCEDYFLYYEEPDWALRAKGRYTLAYAPDSIVYHKVAVSTGLLNKKGLSRDSSIWHEMRSHVRFTRRFFPKFSPIVVIKRGIQALLLLSKNGVVRCVRLISGR
jgi:GT2 family glycosyltransferase